MASHEFPELTSTETTLLVRFVEFADKYGLTRVEVSNIHTSTQEFGVRPIMLRAMFDRLCQKSLLFVSRDRDPRTLEDTLYFEISPAFADQIDTYVDSIRRLNNIPLPVSAVAAADKFVAIGNHSEAVDETMDAIDQLCASIKAASDLIANSDHRHQLCTEFDYFKEVVNKKRIHLSAVTDLANNNSTLKWLADQRVSIEVQRDASALSKTLHALAEILER